MKHTLNQIATQASLELEIDSLVEQSTDLHSLYARQDELLKRFVLTRWHAFY